jgi:hypothetical protein
MTSLPRVKSGLLKHALENQVLIYDTESDRVHLLDPTTACVLELLEQGPISVDGLKDRLSSRLDISANDALVQLAVEQLRNADLIEQGLESPFLQSEVSRRDLIRTVAAAGIAAVLVPSVASLTATRGYAQATAPNHGVGNTCTGPSQCISGNCCNGFCIATGATCPTAGSVPNGGACNVAIECASGVCTGGFCKGANNTDCANGNGCQSNRCCGGKCRSNTCGAGGSANCTTVGPDSTCCSGQCGCGNANCTGSNKCTEVVCN